MTKTATIIGATGLTGGYLLDQLLEDPFYDTVRILVRRPLERTHPKLEKKIVDFTDGDSLLIALSNSDAVFCCIGTTNKKVKGDNEAYRKVDYDIPVHVARFTKMTGCEKFLFVSSVGASPRSKSFYLKLKGDVEEAIKQTGLKSIHIFRPSMLLGDRKEFRRGEGFWKGLFVAFSFLLPSKYKPIHAKKVAMKMLAVSKLSEEGVFVYEYRALS